MEKRQLGKTDLYVSIIGFGSWAIGGPAMAGTTPLGWGDVDDTTSMKALLRACELGINFYDTADIYGLGHSEELIGKVFGNRGDIIVATKVGYRLGRDDSIIKDFSSQHILKSCEESLRRLKRERIDLYQLHSAKVTDLQQGECIDALEQLRERGKIRYWGTSLNTFKPEPEAEYLMEKNLGWSFQLVLNIINQRSIPLLRKAAEQGYGTIVRMPLQFGLLSGKFTRDTRFPDTDHRSFRLTAEIISQSRDALESVSLLAEKYGISKSSLSLSFCASFPEVSTIIPGMKTLEQVEMNTAGIERLSQKDLRMLAELYTDKFAAIVELMEKQG